MCYRERACDTKDYSGKILGRDVHERRQGMHLQQVSTAYKVQTVTSDEREDHDVHENFREHRAPGRSDTPIDERTARVNALRAQVRAGTYQVDSHTIAAALLKKPINFT
jgi:anti-sigma28 factor (negative regulator of flagellin synthesis)